MTNPYTDLKSRYSGLIFDCDGTLTDSMPLHYRAWTATLDRHGIRFPESRFYEMGGVPTTKIVKALAVEQGVDVNVNEVSKEKEEEFMGMIVEVQPNDPVCEIARRYHGLMPLAVASGGIRDVIINQLLLIGVIDLFDTLVGAEDTQRHKPEPDVFLEAAKRIGIEPARCLVFEDTDIGIEAACRAGMDYVDVRNLPAGPQPCRLTDRSS